MGRLAKGAKPVYLKRHAVVDRAESLRLSLTEIAARCGKTSNYLYGLMEQRYQVPPKIEERLRSALNIKDKDWPLFFERVSLPGEKHKASDLHVSA